MYGTLTSQRHSAIKETTYDNTLAITEAPKCYCFSQIYHVDVLTILYTIIFVLRGSCFRRKLNGVLFALLCIWLIRIDKN